MIVVIQDSQVLWCWSLIRCKSDTPVHESVLSAFVPFECLVSNLFLSVDQTISVSVMIEVDLSHTAIDLDKFLPVG